MLIHCRLVSSHYVEPSIHLTASFRPATRRASRAITGRRRASILPPAYAGQDAPTASSATQIVEPLFLRPSFQVGSLWLDPPRPHLLFLNVPPLFEHKTNHYQATLPSRRAALLKIVSGVEKPLPDPLPLRRWAHRQRNLHQHVFGRAQLPEHIHPRFFGIRERNATDVGVERFRLGAAHAIGFVQGEQVTKLSLEVEVEPNRPAGAQVLVITEFRERAEPDHLRLTFVRGPRRLADVLTAFVRGVTEQAPDLDPSIRRACVNDPLEIMRHRDHFVRADQGEGDLYREL